MAFFAGRHWNRKELRSYLGDMEQIAYVRQSILQDGKASNVRALNFENGGGLHFSILPGRAMDIPEVYYRGWPLHFSSGTGITHPNYYEEPGIRWLRSFYAGLLTTCGITYAGHPQTDQGKELGLHGRISNTEAECLSIRQEWDGDEYILSASGRMREVMAMGENMVLSRLVETKLGDRGFTIVDRIENRGFESQPVMMLYHFNFGFPLLSPSSYVVAPRRETRALNEESAKDDIQEQAFSYPEPIPSYTENLFSHRLAADSDGNTFIALVNREHPSGHPLAIVLGFSLEELPGLMQWKMPRKGFYVTGLEPCTVVPTGREKLRKEGKLPMLEGMNERSIRIEFEVLDSEDDIDALEERSRALSRSR